jgi:signal transduction histidine kinase
MNPVIDERRLLDNELIDFEGFFGTAPAAGLAADRGSRQSTSQAAKALPRAPRSGRSPSARYDEGMNQSSVETQDAAPAATDVDTLGQLVGQMAHDLNNLIATATFGVELALKAPLDADARRLLDSVMQAMLQQQSLTTAMARAAQSCEHAATLDLHDSIAGAADELRAILDPATLELQLDASDARVRVDARFLRAALRHLAMHAHAAMPAGGRMRISTRNMQGPFPARADARWLCLEVADDGASMEAPRARAFELFSAGKAGVAGLGLAQVRDTLRRVGGTARLVGDRGEGTCIELAFPLLE